MIAWWVWLLVILGGLIGGALIGAVGFLIWSWWHTRSLKSQLPKLGTDKKANTEYINAEGETKMLNGGQAIPLTEKEAKDDETRKLGKFREFEKLRRFSQAGKRDNNDTAKSARHVESVPGESVKASVPDEDIADDEFDDEPDERPIKLH